MVRMSRARPERASLGNSSHLVFVLQLPRRDHPQAQRHVGCKQDAARQQQEETNQLALLSVCDHGNQRSLQQSIQHPLTVESKARHRVDHG